jgi:antitoxin VapB
MNNRTQAVRIPKALAFPASVKRVNIRKQGDSLILEPALQAWDDWFESGPFDADFPDREQPQDQERDLTW